MVIGCSTYCLWCGEPMVTCVINTFCSEQCREARTKYRENAERLLENEVEKQRLRVAKEDVPDYQI